MIDARVLRSQPLLDGAALAAVRQWRYTPTLLNGVPVRVLMTVTINFKPGQSRSVILIAMLYALVVQIAPQAPTPEDPTLTAAVRLFFEMQEKEDVDGYLALWSMSTASADARAALYLR